MTAWLAAVRSGWRAGLKQYRTARTKQRKAAITDQANDYQRSAIAGSQSQPEPGYDVDAAGTYTGKTP